MNNESLFKDAQSVSLDAARILQNNPAYTIHWRPDESLPEEEQFALVAEI